MARGVKTFGALMMLGCLAPTGAAQAAQQVQQVQQVTISGYSGTAMESFVSRDGRYLLFNNSNDPRSNTDLFYALRKNDLEYVFKGPVRGINTPALEGAPTLDRTGTLYFVSTRSYAQTSCTIYSAQFRAGGVSTPRLVDSICLHQPGVVNFDVDITPDGEVLTFVDSQFGPDGQPQTAQLVMANRQDTGFVRLKNSAALLAQVNTGRLQYAPALSANHLELWFTRADPASSGGRPQIWHAQRSSPTAPFGAPTRLEGLGDFVEGPALSANEKCLYFHRKVGSSFRIFTVLLN